MLFSSSFGKLDAQPIVFLHGFLGSHVDFLPIIEDLKETFYCVALDLPAHGNSPYTKEILTSVEKSLKPFKKPILVGYSMGGRIALQLAQRESLSLNGIVAISSHIGLSCLKQKELRALEDLVWKKRLETLSQEEFLHLWYKQPVFASLQKKPHLLSDLLSKRSYTNPSELALVLEEMSLANQPLLDTFPCPSYFLFGEEDTKYKDLYSTLHKSTLKDGIAKAGHTLLIENPKRCSELIKKWITKLNCLSSV